MIIDLSKIAPGAEYHSTILIILMIATVATTILAAWSLFRLSSSKCEDDFKIYAILFIILSTIVLGSCMGGIGISSNSYREYNDEKGEYVVQRWTAGSEP